MNFTDWLALQRAGESIRPIIQIKISDRTVTLTGREIQSQGMLYDTYCSRGETLAFGTSTAAELTFTFYPPENIPEQDWYTADSVSLFYQDASTPPVFVGDVYDVHKGEDGVKITALGDLTKLETLYFPELHAATLFPKEQNALKDIAAKCMELSGLPAPTTPAGALPFANESVTVKRLSDEALSHSSMRSILSDAASLLGASIIFSDDGGVSGYRLKTPTVTTIEIPEDVILTAEIGDGDLTVSGVYMDLPQETVLAGTEAFTVDVMSNLFAMTQGVEAWATALANRNKQITFRPCLLTLCDAPAGINLLDVIKFRFRGKAYQTLVTGISTSFNGQAKLECIGLNYRAEKNRPKSLASRVRDNELKTQANIDRVFTEMDAQHAEAMAKYDQERQERIDAVAGIRAWADGELSSLDANLTELDTNLSGLNTDLGNLDTEMTDLFKKLAGTKEEINAGVTNADSILGRAKAIVDSNKGILDAVAGSKDGNYYIKAGAIDLIGVVNLINTSTDSLTQIDGGRIKTGTVTSNQIATHTINAGNIASGVITTRMIQAGAIKAEHIAAKAITAGKIAAYAVGADQISADQAFANKLTSNSFLADSIWTRFLKADKLSANFLKTQIADIGGWKFNAHSIFSESPSSFLVLNNASTAKAQSWNIIESGEIVNGKKTYKFKVGNDGTMYAYNGFFSGEITATRGKIGGWSIGLHTLSTIQNSKKVKIDLHDGTQAGWRLINVKRDGATIFGVNDDGSIIATEGKIANWTIKGNTIKSESTEGKKPFIKFNNTFVDWAAIEVGDSEATRFKVLKTGVVHASDVVLSGTHNGTHNGDSHGTGYFWSGGLGNAEFGNGGGTNVYISGGVFDVISTGGFTLRTSTFTMRTTTKKSKTVFLTDNGFTFQENSDIRKKDNVEELTHEFDDVIYNLPLIRFSYKDDPKKTPYVGVNANLIAKITPKRFSENFLNRAKETGLWGADYTQLIPYMIRTIQDLNMRVKELEAMNG